MPSGITLRTPGEPSSSGWRLPTTTPSSHESQGLLLLGLGFSATIAWGVTSIAGAVWSACDSLPPGGGFRTALRTLPVGDRGCLGDVRHRDRVHPSSAPAPSHPGGVRNGDRRRRCRRHAARAQIWPHDGGGSSGPSLSRVWGQRPADLVARLAAELGRAVRVTQPPGPLNRSSRIATPWRPCSSGSACRRGRATGPTCVRSRTARDR